MQVKNRIDVADIDAVEQADREDLLSPLLAGQPAGATAAGPPLTGVVIGELLAVTGDGQTPLVAFAGQRGTAAVAARTAIDLHGAHIGLRVVLMFEDADPTKPVVLGILRDGRDPLESSAGTVDVDADGERLVVAAKHQLVMRCGKASITLTKAGKVLIQGAYVSTCSSGVLRIKGGSVQIN